MDILEQIFAERREAVEAAKGNVSLDELREAALLRRHHSLLDRLGDGDEVNIIAEVKKASPSAGCLRDDYRPAEVAALYEKAGAVGISVLTEPLHFLGSAEHLKAVRQAVDLPILRKDFICDSYQVHESAAWGADIILLIAAGLDDGLLMDLYLEALDCGLEVLAEAHSAGELERILALKEAIIGVNSRNLKTLKTDVSVAQGLAEMIPDDRVSIAESGIKSQSDIAMLKKVEYSGFLIGESMLRADDPGKVLRDLAG